MKLGCEVVGKLSVSEMPKILFYKSLNDLSTADFYTERKRKKSRFYEIERVVSKRVGKEKVSESALLRVFD